MYPLNTPVSDLKGIGPKTAERLATTEIHTLNDLLLQVPLRYEDRSLQLPINSAPLDQSLTLKATVLKVSVFRRPGRNITTVTVVDPTGKLKLTWFNTSFIAAALKEGEEYYFSGKISSKYKSMSHPAFEKVGESSIHTNRLVPMYSSLLPFPQGKWRKLLFSLVSQIPEEDDLLVKTATEHGIDVMPLGQALKTLHFPETAESVIQARERLALEEFIRLVRHSQQLKKQKNQHNTAHPIKLHKVGSVKHPYVPDSVPFELTTAQNKALSDIFSDIQTSISMDRLLVGDVGSGKTIVAGLAALQVIKNGQHAFLIAPTKILAQQHAQTLEKILPELSVVLIKTGKDKSLDKATKPTLFIGTHVLIPALPAIQPTLVIYDEQHRFGVGQRSTHQNSDKTTPHVMTMSATPIPRSLMQTIFAHVELSVIDEKPKDRKPPHTWLITDAKKEKSWEWITQTVSQTKSQALIVCPFIDPSTADQLEDVAAATEYFTQLETKLESTNLRLGLLHGRQKPKEQQEIISQVYTQEIDILVCTPMVEVGVDLPQASIMVIEAAERFGLASLHQLRGRVGRAGQESWCLVCPSPGKDDTARLRQFCAESDGFKLAEYDLQNRGAGDLLGTRQSGFEFLRFGSWGNTILIDQAKLLSKHLPGEWGAIVKQN